ncbi:hypothetical protein IM40_00350 [Candidatus Paracaedimonas acanthamoebae]|nr:hypothetical protein IM40_00350 [Candidatus Paracaedimonas acanthamoebae]
MQFNLSHFPTELAILDLPGMILLPRGHLPIHLTEEKYKLLIEEALKSGRYVGVVQTDSRAEGEKLFRSGCLGKITTFSEGDDGDYFVILSGVCRFNLLAPQETSKPYFIHSVSYETFSFDVYEERENEIDREKLLNLVKAYFSSSDLTANWDEIKMASNERLISSLTLLCPFDPQEKQALLESPTLTERTQMMTALLEIAFLRNSQASWFKH